jgi:WD40 repeat protein
MKKTTSERVEAEASSEHPSPGLRLRHTLRGYKDEIWPIAWSPDGRTLALGSRDQTIRLWDGDTGKPLGTLRGHKDAILSVAWSPDGRTLASGSGSGDNTIRLWDGESGEQLQTPEGLKGSVYQDAIPKVKSVSVIIGTKCLGRWQIMELRTFIS